MSRIGLLSHESRRVEQLTAELDRTLMIEQASPELGLADAIPGYDRSAMRIALAAVIESLARLVDPHNVPKPEGVSEPVPGGLVGRIRSEQRDGAFPSSGELVTLAERLREPDTDLRASDVVVLQALSRAARAEATQIDRLLTQ